MVTQTTTTTTAGFDVKQALLYDGVFGPKETQRLAQVVSRDFSQFEILRDSVQELQDKEKRGELSPAAKVRLGVGLYLTGNYADAKATLKSSDNGALALFYLARTLSAMEQYGDALKTYDSAKKAGYNSDDCSLGKAEVYRCMKEPEKGLAELDKISGASEQTAEYLYQRGTTVSAIGNNPDEALALYRRAEAADRNHIGALFGLALERERGGFDEEALELYKRAAVIYPAHVGLLFNLGLLYEDLGQYDQAVVCYQRILDSFPNNERAKLFLKDAKASNNMHIDEDAKRRTDKLGHVLNQPISDFELPVRARNCLKSMDIVSLGDLCKHTEHDLLASKNFGENSLMDIKEMLALKGLRLGQFAEEKPVAEAVDINSLPVEEQEKLLQSVDELNLTVRAKKCLNRNNIQTIGELLQKTADELLKCKNFGITSLNEIRDKLREKYNLKLRGE